MDNFTPRNIKHFVMDDNYKIMTRTRLDKIKDVTEKTYQVCPKMRLYSNSSPVFRTLENVDIAASELDHLGGALSGGDSGVGHGGRGMSHRNSMLLIMVSGCMVIELRWRRGVVWCGGLDEAPPPLWRWLCGGGGGRGGFEAQEVAEPSGGFAHWVLKRNLKCLMF